MVLPKWINSWEAWSGKGQSLMKYCSRDRLQRWTVPPFPTELDCGVRHGGNGVKRFGLDAFRQWNKSAGNTVLKLGIWEVEKLLELQVSVL